MYQLNYSPYLYICSKEHASEKLTTVDTFLNKIFFKGAMFLAHGQRFSQGTPASSTTKTGRHDIAEILLKVALKHKKKKKKSNLMPLTMGKQLVNLSLAAASRVHSFL
jgi:hypothetical protein